MKIKVILKETIKGVGKKDEIVEVKDGYANNFLFSQNKAVPATPENINKLNSKNEKIKKNHDNDVKKANELKEQLNIDVDKKKVSTDARMKELGLHTVELKLHSEVKATIKIKLEAQD